jgi:hypothetical protein
MILAGYFIVLGATIIPSWNRGTTQRDAEEVASRSQEPSGKQSVTQVPTGAAEPLDLEEAANTYVEARHLWEPTNCG